MSSRGSALRRRTHEILEVAHPHDRASRVADVSLMVLIALSLLAVVLESVPSIAARHGGRLAIFESVSVAIFTLEYALRIWSAAEAAPAGSGLRGAWRARATYVGSRMALIDLIAIVPFYIEIALGIDLRLSILLRLFRVFKFTRYSGALRMILEVVHQERKAFATAALLLAVTLIFAASGIYMVEHQAQPEAFGSIPAAMWWAVSALTTVGYGDVTPITPAGRMFAAFVTVLGVAMVALPTSIMASGFAAVSRRNHRRLEDEAALALEDGYWSAEEIDSYAAEAERLGVPSEIAREIARRAASRGPRAHDACPHCGKSLD